MRWVPAAGSRRCRLGIVLRLAVGAGLLTLLATPTALALVTGRSPTCGPVSGKSAKDLANLKTFCEKGVTSGVAVGAYAMESLLWIKVPRDVADAFSQDRLTAEQVMKTWMKGWKQESGSKAVTIYVEWEDVEIAKGGNNRVQRGQHHYQAVIAAKHSAGVGQL